MLPTTVEKFKSLIVMLACVIRHRYKRTLYEFKLVKLHWMAKNQYLSKLKL